MLKVVRIHLIELVAHQLGSISRRPRCQEWVALWVVEHQDKEVPLVECQQVYLLVSLHNYNKWLQEWIQLNCKV